MDDAVDKTTDVTNTVGAVTIATECPEELVVVVTTTDVVDVLLAVVMVVIVDWEDSRGVTVTVVVADESKFSGIPAAEEDAVQLSWMAMTTASAITTVVRKTPQPYKAITCQRERSTRRRLNGAAISVGTA